jgi:hypothetical protein
METELAQIKAILQSISEKRDMAELRALEESVTESILSRGNIARWIFLLSRVTTNVLVADCEVQLEFDLPNEMCDALADRMCAILAMQWETLRLEGAATGGPDMVEELLGWGATLEAELVG